MAGLTTAEWRIMNCLWQEAPLTVRDVHERVEQQTEWSYSTVKTLLSRLVDKGVITVARRGNTNYFTPCTSRDEARQSAVGHLVNHAFSGGAASLVRHLIRGRRLKPAELDELRHLLDSEMRNDRAGRDE